MSDQPVRIRIRLRQPVEDSDSAVPRQEGRPPLHRRDDTWWLRKSGRAPLFALGVLGGLGGLGGTLAVGLVVAYVSWPTNESEPSRSEAAGIRRAVIGTNGSINNGIGTGGTPGASASGSRSSWALQGSIQGFPDLNLDTAAELPARCKPVEMPQASGAEEVRPALADVKYDQDPRVAEVDREAARVLVPGRVAGQDDRSKAWASLSPPQHLEAVPSADRRVACSHLTSRIQGREPVDRLESSVWLTRDKSRAVFYFIELCDLVGHTVFHRWERNGKVVATLSFKVEG